MKIKLRSANKSDIEDIYSIELQSFSTPWSLQSLQMEIEENLLSIYRVILVEQKIVGYAGFWKIVDEAHITNIALDAQYRGLGLSKILLKDIIEQCELLSIEAITLEVRKSNEPAIGLYKRFGFVEKGVRVNYYEDTKEDALIMWKYLKEKK